MTSLLRKSIALLLTAAMLFCLGCEAFAQTLTLPSSLKTIEEEAFFGDTSLDEVVLPEGVTTIGPRAFAESSLTAINLPDSLESIADDALPSPGIVTVTANKDSPALGWAVDKGYLVAIDETNFPDDIFRTWVAENCDTDGNGALNVDELAAVTKIDVSGTQIESLVGIRLFPALKELHCGGTGQNNSLLSALDLSGLAALERLQITFCALEELDLTGCENLDYLGCSFTQLESLDLSGCPALTELACNGNQLAALDVSGCEALVSLECSHNRIEELILSRNPLLTTLSCDDNPLTGLDLSFNPALETLTCSQIDLALLDLRANPLLKHFEGGPTAMDIRGCTKLVNVYDAGVRTGDARPPWLPDFVDYYGGEGFDGEMMVNHATQITAHTGVAIDETNFPDANFRAWVAANCDAEDENGEKDGYLSADEIAAVTKISLISASIASFKGVKYFSALEKLECMDNDMTALDLTANKALSSLNCDGCGSLAMVDVSGLTALETLSANFTSLETLNIQGCGALRQLTCYMSSLPRLDLTGCTILMDAFDLGARNDFSPQQHNMPDSAVVYGGEGDDYVLLLGSSDVIVTPLAINENSFPDVIFGAYTAAEFDGNGDGKLDADELAAAKNIDVHNMGIASLTGLEHFTALEELVCSQNGLTSLDLSHNPALTTLDCSMNGLKTLDLSHNPALTSVICSNTALETINLIGCRYLLEAIENAVPVTTNPGALQYQYNDILFVCPPDAELVTFAAPSVLFGMGSPEFYLNFGLHSDPAMIFTSFTNLPERYTISVSSDDTSIVEAAFANNATVLTMKDVGKAAVTVSVCVNGEPVGNPGVIYVTVIQEPFAVGDYYCPDLSTALRYQYQNPNAAAWITLLCDFDDPVTLPCSVFMGPGSDPVVLDSISIALNGYSLTVEPDEGYTIQTQEANGVTTYTAVEAVAGTVYLTLAHNMAADHAINIALVAWAEAVSEATDGAIEIDVMPGGMLGSEADCVNQIQAGSLEMTKVSAGTLSNFNSAWSCMSVPYVFGSKDALYSVMNGEIGQDLYALTEDDGFVGLAWLESGTRCFYTKNTPIRTPADMNGLRIRTMDSQMAVDMINALGGAAVSMGYANIYSAMQAGFIDGAENNITALRDHAEVTGYYCYDEHTMIPDIIVISSEIWNSLTTDQQAILRSTAADMVANFRALWAQFEADVKAQIEGEVEYITDVDKAAFRAAVQGIYDNLAASDPAAYSFVQRILAAQ